MKDCRVRTPFYYTCTGRETSTVRHERHVNVLTKNGYLKIQPPFVYCILSNTLRAPHFSMDISNFNWDIFGISSFFKSFDSLSCALIAVRNAIGNTISPTIDQNKHNHGGGSNIPLGQSQAGTGIARVLSSSPNLTVLAPWSSVP